MRRAGDFVPFTPPVQTPAAKPAISLPLEVAQPKGLPVGVQLVAAYGREDVLIRIASQLETGRNPWIHRTPEHLIASSYRERNLEVRAGGGLVTPMSEDNGT